MIKEVVILELLDKDIQLGLHVCDLLFVCSAASWLTVA